MKCNSCDGTGIFKKPIDQKRYEKFWNMYDDMGVFTLGECREKALKKIGYEEVSCSNCNGTGKQE